MPVRSIARCRAMSLPAIRASSPMKAMLCDRFGTPDDLVLADIPDPVAGAGRGRGQGRGGRPEFLRHADHRRQIPDQAAVPVLAGRRVRRRRRKRRRRRRRLQARRPRHGLHQFQRRARTHGRRGRQARQAAAGLDFDRAAGAHHHLRHRAITRSRIARSSAPARRWPCWARPAASGWRQSSSASIMGARVIACASTDDKLAFARAHGAARGA